MYYSPSGVLATPSRLISAYHRSLQKFKSNYKSINNVNLRKFSQDGVRITIYSFLQNILNIPCNLSPLIFPPISLFPPSYILFCLFRHTQPQSPLSRQKLTDWFSKIKQEQIQRHEPNISQASFRAPQFITAHCQCRRNSDSLYLIKHGRGNQYWYYPVFVSTYYQFQSKLPYQRNSIKHHSMKRMEVNLFYLIIQRLVVQIWQDLCHS